MIPFQKKAARPQSAQWLPFGAVKPAGWMRLQMQRDLEHGFLGHLDELVPDLIQKDDIYGADRLTKGVRTKDLGIYAPDVRFNFSSENGELWAQASLLRVLLGYYEATGETRVLAAVLAAVDATRAG
jgi:hypothetical protein